MVKPIDWMPDAVPSMDCPAAPFTEDFEDNFRTRRERFPETYPPLRSVLRKLLLCMLIKTRLRQPFQHLQWGQRKSR